ncbi:MAG: sugar phosphate isomerase/epimerase [Clostridiales bacterium]|nr:sugar phosphate isomerase/epimerase [Clostridiales bacterium]
MAENMFRLAAFADEADKALAGQIEAMKRNGISLLEIRGVDGKNVSSLTPEEARMIKQKLDDEGISVWSTGSPIGKIEISDDFAPHYDKFLNTLEIAHILGAKNIRLFSFYHTGIDISDGLRDEVLERLSRFLEAAKGSGITLCHENEKGIFDDIASRCEEMHKALPELRAVFDPANFACCGEEVLHAWEVLRPYVKYLHIKDVAENGRIVPAGEGICNIAELLVRYRDNGGGVLTIEPHLTVFHGLSALEKKGERSNIAERRFTSPAQAFDTAVNSLKSIINNIN